MDNQQQNLFDPEPSPWELDDEDHHFVAGVVFSTGPDGSFDYLIPDSLRDQLEPGRRVRVPFGRSNRTIVGYCVEVGSRQASSGGSRRLKSIQSIVDSEKLLSAAMLQLTKWISQYYLCGWGQVLEAVVPAGVRAKAGTREVTLLSVSTKVASRISQLKLPEKQAKALRILAASPTPLTPPRLAAVAGCTIAPIMALRKKGLVEAEVRRLQHHEQEVSPPAKREEAHQLNGDQQQALNAINEAIKEGRHQTFVVHGVTGSGKTEVYIRAIEEVVQLRRQAIVLVPEISLTPQTRQRFQSRFDSVAVLHSHLSAVERHWHWQRIARGEVQVVVGARSAVFAPIPYLGLIIIDEEHDSSFKQDSQPRYHALDVALHRTEVEQIPLVLGSATPSLESYQRALEGKYKLLEMPHRVLHRPLPTVATLDMRLDFHSRRSRGAISRQLHQAIHQAIQDDGQVILLLNRRGFSTHIQCPACGKVVKCPDCDIALTHHRTGEKAVCHYCEYEISAPPACPECGFEGIRYGGLGTQRLEAEVRARFPGINCLRMDSDTMQKPGSHEKAFAKFRSGETKILLGTQMIAKGLDFPNVTLVGVINADTALHLPDFRAAERTFQLVTQVAGRTGRGEKGGRVLVQTFSPDHPAITAAVRHDYKMFAAQELPHRQEYGYPPFSSMIRIVVRGPGQQPTEQFTSHLGQCLLKEIEQQGSDAQLLGPSEAPIAKLRGKFRFHLLLRSKDREKLRSVVRQATANLKPPEDVQWIIDIDPWDML